ncbi:bacteriohemerythrin [Varunaivibrio sulfuroxidans]|nr:bacteriohemerythrin [Varunaivibrio sulfuroxidans]WES30270.1 bacteriohemerythrin [Varunaivibrio sulfuroxidans]
MLINITNELFSRVDNGFTQEEISQTISCLNDYVNRHFEREESLFIDSEYPDTQEHIKTHREISKTVANISALYKQDPNAINIHEVLEFLRDWLTKHILRADQQYAPYIGVTVPSRRGASCQAHKHAS